MPLLRFLLLSPLHLLRLLGMVFKITFTILGKVLSPLTGQIQWQAPSWVSFVTKFTTRIEDFTKRYPLHIGAFLLVCIAGAIGGIYGYHWYQNRPGPIAVAPTEYKEVEATLNKAPSPTNYRAESPSFDNLVINFRLPVAPLETLKSTITEGVEISPKLEGAWRWSASGAQLIFVPSKDWAMNQAYTVSFNPAKLFAQNIKIDKTSLSFTTDDMSYSATGEFYQDPVNPSQKKSIFQDMACSFFYRQLFLFKLSIL